ncbi:MAG: DUF2027 domain-containing protein [Cytophagales bacterium]
MFVGDKVKSVHGFEKGVVIKIISPTQAEIETDDGFLIPVMKKDWVVVNQKEAKYFGEPEKTIIKTKIISQTNATNGIFVAWVKEGQNQLCYFINNADYEVLFTFHEKTKDNSWVLVKSTVVDPKEFLFLKSYDDAQFNAVKTIAFQHMMLKKGGAELPKLQNKELFVNKQQFKESPVQLPLIEKLGQIIQIDLDPKEAAKEIQQGLQKSMEKASTQSIKIIPPPKEVDLHIEKLSPIHGMLSSGDMFKIQMKEFESCLDRAIACGMDEIVFIHGVGSGSLKNAIHKALSKNPNVAHFQDAQKEKFGYGATKAKLK